MSDPFAENPNLVADLLKKPADPDDIENELEPLVDKETRKKEARTRQTLAEVKEAEAEVKKEEMDLRKAKVQFQKDKLEEDKKAKGKAKLSKDLQKAHQDMENARRQGAEEDELKEHMRLFRIIQRMRNELGLLGSGRPITMNTPLEIKEAELGLIRQQGDEKNAEGFAKGGLNKLVEYVEEISVHTVPREMLCLRGDVSLSEEWKRKTEEDDMLAFNIRRLEIEYSSYFTVGPKMTVALALLSLAKEVNAANQYQAYVNATRASVPEDFEV